MKQPKHNVELAPGEQSAYDRAPEGKKVDVLNAIFAARQRLARQRAAVNAKGSKVLAVDKEGQVEGMSYGTPAALQPRDKELWARLSADPAMSQRKGLMLANYVRRTQMAEADVVKWLES